MHFFANKVLKCFALLLLIFPVVLKAQPAVNQITPRQNEINFPQTGTIFVEFTESMNGASMTPATFIVRGSQTGNYIGNILYNGGTRTAEFAPSSFFKEGEVVWVTLTAGITNSSGVPMAPFQWSFTVAVEFGTGVFDERIEIPLDENQRDPAAIFTGDFDNDFFPDLAVVNNGANSVSIFQNEFFKIAGSFLNSSSVSVGNGPNSITGADFNNDGFLDLAVSNFDDNTISILRNNGSFSFSLIQTIVTAEHPTQVEAADFNNDGFVDLASTILGVNQLQVFLNTSGSFGVSDGDFDTGPSPYSLATGDFDNDGDVDIVVSNSGDNTIIVYRNNGQASFLNAGFTTVPDFPTQVRTGDFIGRSVDDFGDGFLDLVVVHPNINTITLLDNRSRDGDFAISQEMIVGVRPADVFVGDLDTTDVNALNSGFGKDHDIDLAVPNFLSRDLHVLRNEFNNGFSNDLSDIYVAGETPVSIAGADFDKDGDVDLAVTNLTTQQVTVLLNNGGSGGGIRFTQPSLEIDFGQVYVGTDSTRNLTLLNPTSESISIDQLTTSLPQFSASAQTGTIDPGQTFNLSVTFSPSDTVVYVDSLVILASAAGQQERVSVGLRGEGIISIISIIPDTLNFGNIQPPQTASLPIEIRNGGNGPLIISDMQFTNSDFSSAAPQLTVDAYSSQFVDIMFSPTTGLAVIDTLTVFNNDSTNSQAIVTLLGGPNNFPPVLTSADTVTAIEDVFFQYIATANDSDGTQSRFIFRDLPAWLNPSSNNPTNASLEGTPLEGDPDTSFVVIASDGIFSDSMQVFVRVLPVNDPPVINPVADRRVAELIPVTITITASDPEDSTLAFTALNLPQGAIFIDSGNKTANLSWTPPFGSRGFYDITLIVTEVFEQPALSDTALFRITVQEAPPDLLVASLGITDTNISLDETQVVTGIARSEAAPVDQPFRLTFFHDGVSVRDTVISRLGTGGEVAFDYVATFDRLGNHQIEFRIDRDDQILESDEDNNSAVLLLSVSKAALQVRPNPFTPNNDGFNDETVFDFSELVLNQPELKIFDFNGVLLMTLNESAGSAFRWNGKDSRGREQKPGIYLYVLLDEARKVSGGYVALAR